MARILLVDDDVELCRLVVEYLEGEAHEVEAVHGGEEGARRAVGEGWDLAILDVMLPGINGFDVLRRIRECGGLPVVMLTARGDDVDRIVGLELGADDYLPKPFNPRELAARIRAILRRAGGESPSGASVVRVGDLELDRGARAVVRAGEPIPVTGVEYELLELLVERAGSVVTREELSRRALGRRPSPYDRSLDTHMSNLRRKLGPLPGGEERLKTLRGVGYQYVRHGDGSRD
jgi:two-component system response regulator CpxR